MAEGQSEDLISVIDLPEERLDIDSENVGTLPINSNQIIPGPVRNHSKTVHSTAIDSPRNSNRTDLVPARKCYIPRNPALRPRSLSAISVSKSNTKSRNKKTGIFKSHTSDAESSVNKSNTFCVPSLHPYSSSGRSATSTVREQISELQRKPSFFNNALDINKRRDKTNFGPRDVPNERNCNQINRPEKPHRKIFVGYNYLKALSEKEPHEMICEIFRKDANINIVLNRNELQADWIMLIVETVRKLCESDFQSNRAQALQYFCESPLLDHISRYLGEVGIEKNQKTIENMNSFISDLVVFYSAVINTIPTIAVDKNFEKFLTKTKMSIDQMDTYLHKKIDPTIVEQLSNLEKRLEDEKNIRESKIGKPRRNYLEVLGNTPPPDDFRELSLYPTHEDLNRHDFGFVRPNKIKGAYDDVNHYLDVQFRLIREDFIDPLRRGLRDYKDAIVHHGKTKYKYESMRLYRNVRIENIEVTKGNQVAYVVNFDVNGKLKIKWEYSKRFMYGSLLIFTRDNFETFFFATVCDRDLQRLYCGQILVILIENEALDPEMFNQSFIMAESEVFFEPYCLVMKALKEYNEKDFPMKQFIVDGDTTVDLPKYISVSKTFDIYNHKVNLVENLDWPDYSAIGFDEHQFNAFRTALTSNFTVIQGPPGTGKTYLGLKIVEVLLKNIFSNRGLLPMKKIKTPILLVCYTNHALDQFLEGILKFTQRIVRAGGQSKSEKLKPFNLRGRDNLHILRKEVRRVLPSLNHCRDEMKIILYNLKKKSAEKHMLENPTGIVSHHILCKVMGSKFEQMILNDDAVLLWLLNINHYSSIARNSRKNITQDVNAGPKASAENYNSIFYEDETAEANVLVDEDEVFDPQNVKLKDIMIYCLSLEDLEALYKEKQHDLEELPNRFLNDYSGYYNWRCRLNDDLRNIDRRYKMLRHYLQNAELGSSKKYSARYVNVWEMPMDLRWTIYWSWISQLKLNFDEELKNLEAQYRSKSQQYAELKQLEDFHVVKNSLVVGMTTTCAARLQVMLKTLSPAIVIVEEAAEVLEAHIVVSLSKKCEHVILIGDHKQLKPSTAVYELSKKYNINISLFERMINNNMYCPQLKIQHRMRPEISSLIVPLIYPDLKNHESVLDYPSVTGITKNLFFIEHTVHEEKVDDSASRKNKFEAEFMIELCRYLLLQGYAAEKITILTTYTGQMFLIREMKRTHAIMRDVKVIVVDKYQGEENDIILLSLVRSNEERKIGFLSTENRVCVALSRAKIGLYIIGNMDILSDSNLWKNIKEELVKQEAIGPKLTLYCDKHDIHTQVSCKSDFNMVLEGGCNEFCHEVLDCGHKCPLVCHKMDAEHKEKKCREKCLRQCIENHPCQKNCFEDCNQCTVPIERTLPCGHKITLMCLQDYQNYSCQVDVKVVLELCSHEIVKKCFEPIENVKCSFPCEDRLDCGHQCLRNCHKTNDPDHLKYNCRKTCEKINPECIREHKCQKSCFMECGKCNVLVDFNLKCGHQLKIECSTDLDKIDCQKPCSRKCPDCNVSCLKKCFEDCPPCENKVMKIIPDCGHVKKMECRVVPERKLCVEKCQRIAPCGHECNSVCSKECGTTRCQKIVKSTCVQALCGHGFASVQCWRKNEVVDAEELLSFCTVPCDTILKCGDLCTGTCGSCWQGRLHKTCQQKCGNVLVCGHSCTFPCREVCPPCTKPCQYSCKHSKCPKDCGVPCAPCEEKCQWKCPHFKCKRKCGDICNRPPCYEPCPKKLPCDHDCIGFCGEPCPPKCRICDEEEVRSIFFGNEDEEDARFVLLEDCDHFIESRAMDKYINMPAKEGEIVMKLCPVCKTPITKTLRYMNQVKMVYRHFQNIKRKIYGNVREMRIIFQDVTRKLKNLDLRKDLLYCKELILIRKTVDAFKEGLQRQFRGEHCRWHYSTLQLRSMNVFINMFSSIISRLDDLKICTEMEKSRVYQRLDFILKRLNLETLRINMQQVDETQKELNRYHRIVDYIVYLHKAEYQISRNSPNVTSINADIIDILYGLKCFDTEQDARIDELFDKLREELKSTQFVSQEEKRMIHAAMAKDFNGGVNSQGHWFTCSKGHYYCITECGGATQESNCPECGERIGGQNHRYVDTARVASDMDGATRPAWPSYSNLRNYRFN